MADGYAISSDTESPFEPVVAARALCVHELTRLLESGLAR
jgi:hypothetical protein